MNRRDFTKGLIASGLTATLAASQLAEAMLRKANLLHSPKDFPKKVAGITTPDSRYVQLAIEEARDSSEPFLFNHAARTYYLGVLLGIAHKHQLDPEVLMIACMLHDLGLTSRHEGELPFEIQGAQAAKAVLSRAGYQPDKCEIVWDGIAMHTQPLADFKRAEISLVGAGAGADVTGADISLLTASDIQAVIHAFPRLDFKNAFVSCCAETIRKFPRAAGRSFMRDIGERMVPGFSPSNICDRIKTSPFDE